MELTLRESIELAQKGSKDVDGSRQMIYEMNPHTTYADENISYGKISQVQIYGHSKGTFQWNGNNDSQISEQWC